MILQTLITVSPLDVPVTRLDNNVHKPQQWQWQGNTLDNNYNITNHLSCPANLLETRLVMMKHQFRFWEQSEVVKRIEVYFNNWF